MGIEWFEVERPEELNMAEVESERRGKVKSDDPQDVAEEGNKRGLVSARIGSLAAERPETTMADMVWERGGREKSLGRPPSSGKHCHVWMWS